MVKNPKKNLDKPCQKCYNDDHAKEEGRAFHVVTPLIVANNYIKRSLEEKIDLTPLKLQKLLYFTYADYYHRSGEMLFSSRFEVWSKGPVLAEVYYYFKHLGDYGLIEEYASVGKEYLLVNEGDKHFGASVRSVWEKYKDRDGDELSRITHEDLKAWSIADVAERLVLDDEDIKRDGEMLFAETAAASK